jgi:hypothetical protein
VTTTANLQNWRRRLDDDEVERIVETTRPVAERFYPGDELYRVRLRHASNGADAGSPRHSGSEDLGLSSDVSTLRG